MDDNIHPGAEYEPLSVDVNLSNTIVLYFVQLRIAKVNPFPPIDETSTSYSCLPLVSFNGVYCILLMRIHIARYRNL